MIATASQPILTFDTGCINVKRRVAALNELEAREARGLIRIHKTDSMDTEFQQTDDASGGTPGSADRVGKAAGLIEDKGAGVWGETVKLRWGGGGQRVPSVVPTAAVAGGVRCALERRVRSCTGARGG